MSIKIHLHQNPLMFKPLSYVESFSQSSAWSNLRLKSLLLSIAVKGLGVMFIWEVECSVLTLQSDFPDIFVFFYNT